MNEPMKFSGPEAVGKPFELFGNFFSKIGKKAEEQGKRNQAFADTVQLHREMERVTTEEQGKRLQQLVQEYHKPMQKVATESEAKIYAGGGVDTTATYREPISRKKQATEEGSAKKSTEKVVKTSTSKKAAKTTKTPSAVPPKTTNKKASATRPAPKVNKELQEINESA